MRKMRKNVLAIVLLAALVPGPGIANADLGTAIGVSDTEIRIGNIMPYTGPLAAFATIGKAEAAYFDMINDNGGINGRKVKFISYDSSCSVRRLRVAADRRCDRWCVRWQQRGGKSVNLILLFVPARIGSGGPLTLSANVQVRSIWDQKNVGFTDTMRSTNAFEKGYGMTFGTVLAKSTEAPKIRSLGVER
jgi:substrate-binding family protein